MEISDSLTDEAFFFCCNLILCCEYDFTWGFSSCMPFLYFFIYLGLVAPPQGFIRTPLRSRYYGYLVYCGCFLRAPSPSIVSIIGICCDDISIHRNVRGYYRYTDISAGSCYKGKRIIPRCIVPIFGIERSMIVYTIDMPIYMSISGLWRLR
jgi:hypothetical protein